MLLVSEVGGEGGCIKLDKISLSLKKFRRADPDLRGNNADGTCKLALRVEDRGTDPDSIVDIFFAGGDAVTGAATVILAMGAGRTAARAIDEYIRKR